MGIAMQRTSSSPKHLFLVVHISLAKPQTLSCNRNARDNMYHAHQFISSRDIFRNRCDKASRVYKFARFVRLCRRRISRAREDQVERPCAWGDYYWCREEGEKEKEMKEEREKKGTGGGEREDYAESVGVTTFGMYFPLRCQSAGESIRGIKLTPCLQF